MRPSRDTTCRGRSRSNAAPPFRPSPATSGRRGLERAGPSTPSSWRTRWVCIPPTQRGSARSPTSPSPRRCWWSIRASMRSGGRATTGSSSSKRTPVFRKLARRYRSTATPCGRARDCRTRSAVWRSVGCGPSPSRPSARSSTSRPSTTTCSRMARFRCRCCASRSSDGSRQRTSHRSGVGCRCVFARYAHDALELELLALATGTERAVTANGAVNVEPRWSPDGARIAFVSSVYHGRWHIFLAAFPSGEVVRLTEDSDSRLPRYYYSRWDHYISPAWSPDGSEILFVSNRGHVHGTGGLWRMAAQPGAQPRELRYEETTWKARPDWAPDGRRVVYSSYLGRQWHQLWLMTSEGGDPFPVTYGEFDATAPRWSRDGKRFAYISNEAGNTALWIMELPGGRRQRVTATERRYREPVGGLRIVITDPLGHPAAGPGAGGRPDGGAHAP